MKTMIKQKQTITRRFLKYLILIIIGSNLIVAMFLYWIMRENAMKQAENLRQSLMESTLVTMQQYFENVDNIADTIIYNEDIIHFMRNKEDTIADMALIRGIESQYYYLNPDLEMSFYRTEDWNSVYSIQDEDGAIRIPDYRYTDWYQEIIWTRDKKVLMANEEETGGAGSVQSCVYKIEDLYTSRVVGYLKIDMNMDYLKERFLHSFNKIAGATILDNEDNVLFYDKMEVRVPSELMEKKRRRHLRNRGLYYYLRNVCKHRLASLSRQLQSRDSEGAESDYSASCSAGFIYGGDYASDFRKNVFHYNGKFYPAGGGYGKGKNRRSDHQGTGGYPG